MHLKTIKEEAADKQAIDGLTGIIEKQYPPADQTDNDKKFSQHRQSFLLNDGEGNKVMVTLMKQPLHILDPREGQRMTITAGKNEKGYRGCVVSRWQKQGDKYESVSVKVYPDATIRLTQDDVAEQPKPQQQATAQAQPQAAAPAATTTQKAGVLPDMADTEFFKHLQLASYGYAMCLDQAEAIIADRPELKDDGENLRAIATNFWMECKHHLRTLAPNLHGNLPPVTRGAAPAAPPATPPAAKKVKTPIDAQTNDEIIARIHKASYMNCVEPLEGAALEAYNRLIQEADDRGLWDAAYDLMEEDLKTELGDKAGYDEAVQAVYDKVNDSPKITNTEKFFVTHPAVWRGSIEELLKTE